MIRDTSGVKERPRAEMGAQRISEYYSALYRNLRLHSPDGRTRQAIGITGIPGCNRISVVATNLAICIATTDQREILLVNADPKNRVPEVTFSLDSEFGIYDVLRGAVACEEAIQATHIPHLNAISCGNLNDRSQAFTSLTRFGAIVDELKRSRQLIIFSLPPAAELTPCFDMCSELDGVVIEIESDRVKKRTAQQVLQQLRFVNANVLGCVFKQA